MKNMIRKIKYQFYQQGITQRIIIVVAALSIFSNVAFVGSVFIIMRHQLINKTVASGEKDLELISNQLNMFFEGIRNDSLSVAVSEACQTLLSDTDKLSQADAKTQFKRYKLIQTTIMSTVGQRPIYNTIVFYDSSCNPFISDGLETSTEYEEQQRARVSEFLKGEEKDTVLSIHKSPWKKKKDSDYEDCISYLRKVYHKETGQMIGIIEFEIPNGVLSALYRPVMGNGGQVYLSYQNQIISAADKKHLYKTLSDTPWYEKLIQNKEKVPYSVVKDRKSIYLLKDYEELDWKLIHTIPASVYMKDIRFYALLDIMIGICLLLLSIFVSRPLIVSITRPLSKITNAILEIGTGNYNRRVSVKDGGEIGTLADEFNRMIDKTELLMGQIVEKEQEKREYELSLVQMQMTPHFFYNILESICGLIVIDEKKTAIHTINLLSSFYRGVLNKGKEIITLEDELNIAINYLEIMKICHPGKFTYKIDCPEGQKKRSINKLTLQPVLENAIHHGFCQMTSGGIIGIRCYESEEKTIIDIEDNGCGIDVEAQLPNKKENARFHMESFGLCNTDERIKLYFGSSYGIRIMRQATGTKIRIELPSEMSDGWEEMRDASGDSGR